MVNEGLLQLMEARIAEVREKGGALVRGYGDGKFSFETGMNLFVEYSSAVEVLQDVSKQLFSPIDLCDPEDNELLSREEEEEEGEDEDGEEGDEDDEDDEEEPS